MLKPRVRRQAEASQSEAWDDRDNSFSYQCLKYGFTQTQFFLNHNTQSKIIPATIQQNILSTFRS
jgi:hypothetical protein